MARIRTVKPDLFKHEDLFDAEREEGLPLRLAFIGLFTVADREGRFKWKPRTLKTDVMPHDDVDFSRVLDALLTRGWLVKYTFQGEEFGCIPTFSRHQVINNRESPSELPSPEEGSIQNNNIDASGTRESRESHATRGEGKGREGKGKEGGSADAARPPATVEKREAKTAATWAAYSQAYLLRYGSEPVRNAKVNSLLGQLVDRIGADEAPEVAAFFLQHRNGYYAQRGHSAECLVADAEKLRTEWATGRTITQTQARQQDKTASNGFLKLIEERERAESQH